MISHEKNNYITHIHTISHNHQTFRNLYNFNVKSFSNEYPSKAYLLSVYQILKRIVPPCCNPANCMSDDRLKSAPRGGFSLLVDCTELNSLGYLFI